MPGPYIENYNPEVRQAKGINSKLGASFGGTVVFAGGTSTTVQTLVSAATITVSTTTGSIFTNTPTQNETINASSVVVGQSLRFFFLTSGTTSYTITFGTNFRSAGTLSTGTVTAKYFIVEFISDGINYVELTRSVAE